MSTKIKTKKRKVKEKLYHSGKDNELIYKPLKRKVTAKGEKKYIQVQVRKKEPEIGRTTGVLNEYFARVSMTRKVNQN